MNKHAPSQNSKDLLQSYISEWDSAKICTYSTLVTRISVVFSILTPLFMSIFGAGGIFIEFIAWTVFFAFIITVIYNSKTKETIRNIAKFDDYRSIQPLVEALLYYRRSVRNIAAVGLSRKITLNCNPIMSKISEKHKVALRKCLLDRNAIVVVAALEIIGAIGDVSALSLVQKITNKWKSRLGGMNIYTTGKLCEKRLETLLSAEIAKANLLRPYRSNDPRYSSSNCDLLEPAKKTNLLPEMELLRPHTIAGEIQNNASDPDTD